MANIEVEVSNHVARITITRPARMNSFDDHTHVEFSAALDRVENEPEIRVAVITGTGDRAFCAGRDLKWTAEMSRASASERAASAARMAKVEKLQERFSLTTPLIARLNGHALGGGLELALACDILIAADHVELGLPEPRRGLVAGAMGMHRLPRQIPHHLAMGYLLTGRHMSAARAYEIGLVNEVVPSAELDATVDSWVADVLECSPAAIRATKESALGAAHLSLAAASRFVSESEAAWQASNDRIEGPRAFAEKRAPEWED